MCYAALGERGRLGLGGVGGGGGGGGRKGVNGGLGWKVWGVMVVQYLCGSAGLTCYGARFDFLYLSYLASSYSIFLSDSSSPPQLSTLPAFNHVDLPPPLRPFFRLIFFPLVLFVDRYRPST